MKRKKPEYTWFVDCAGSAHTNEVVCRNLGLYESDESNVFCEDGERRNFWQMLNYEQLKEAVNVRQSFGLKFTIWVRQGKNGMARKWYLDQIGKAFVGNLPETGEMAVARDFAEKAKASKAAKAAAEI